MWNSVADRKLRSLDLCFIKSLLPFHRLYYRGSRGPALADTFNKCAAEVALISSFNAAAPASVDLLFNKATSGFGATWEHTDTDSSLRARVPLRFPGFNRAPYMAGGEGRQDQIALDRRWRIASSLVGGRRDAKEGIHL